MVTNGKAGGIPANFVPMKQITIEGKNITDIASFYDEINRVFMNEEDWKLGNSLDALNDLLYGGYGAIKGKEPLQLIWNDIDENADSLGLKATKSFYQCKLQYPGRFDIQQINKKLTELDEGAGQTYFDMILEIIAAHSNIALIKN